MLGLGGRRIDETHFYSLSGRRAVIPSDWLGSKPALSLSRAAMDEQLLGAARSLGVTVREDTAVAGIELDGHAVTGVIVRSEAGNVTVAGDIFVDATGRSAVLSRFAARELNVRHGAARPYLIGFKTHLSGVAIERDICEIYSFPGGYGGLSPIEDGSANLCFLVRADEARKLGSDADRIVKKLVTRNPRAHEALRDRQNVSPWLAVAVAAFGERRSDQLSGLFSIGDAASFIDPFTGSGMLMALESAELFAKCIERDPNDHNALADVYQAAYAARFKRRLAVCRVLRHASLNPLAATTAIIALGFSKSIGRRIARLTRGTVAGSEGTAWR
jgi:flavin-dependent dehydrogenase